MLALSGLCEGFARGFLSLHRAAFSASCTNSANSNYSRTYEPFSRKSNDSRTYGHPGEGVYRSPGQTIPATPFPASPTKKQGGVGLGHTNDQGISIGLFGGGGGEVLGGRWEFEMDGVERAVLGGGEIADDYEAEIGLRVAELQLGVESGVWRDVGDQDPVIAIVGMPGWRLLRS